MLPVLGLRFLGSEGVLGFRESDLSGFQVLGFRT